jgi:hypothetical protein
MLPKILHQQKLFFGVSDPGGRSQSESFSLLGPLRLTFNVLIGV